MKSEESRVPNLQCPIPLADYPRVILAHGGGGRLMHQLVEKMFLSVFDPAGSRAPHDSAVLGLPVPKIAWTTDSYVVRPLFFPGGDIGKLAVYGTVNDLAMAGARPLYISLGMILEEGLAMELLWKIVLSLKKAADTAGVRIVTGDTKVVEKGKGDGIFINTSGVGVLENSLEIRPEGIRPGDAILLNGDVGRHGMAIMASREGLAFESEIESDCAPLADLVVTLLRAGIEIHCLRDLTRGGLASALNELAGACQLDMAVEEAAIPVHENVHGACEMLGFDPLYVANEGKMIAFVPEAQCRQALAVMKKHSDGKESSCIGRVSFDKGKTVSLRNRIETHRILDMISGEQLPRIC